ncbi:GAF domain-containing protein [Halorubrum sp. JWXQ-INN 858]|uniref:sensor histidine kinase n=1 Tax=Halorubrum sp. JWXQ-INN 858 TaxID=2690782 RepID=UPI0013596891|nr:GAF domain-containing sensor histidine kinase [Halorubrum sp. JWXQ-INN 858]MWV65714.1 GAF domain-containing protein [Halorubrum sp. JWXQ-INN 858]
MPGQRLDAAAARERLYAVMHDDGTFEEKAERAMAIAVDYLDVENGHLARTDPDGDYWRTVASTDPPGGRFPNGSVFPLSRTYCRRAIDGHGSLVVNHATDEGWTDDPAYVEHGIECYHGTPLRVDGDLYGTLCFVSVEPRSEPFSPAETTFAELVARLLESELQHERLASKVDRLDGFAAVLSHDLRNPLNVAQGRVDLERERNDTENLRIAVTALDRIESLIADVLTVARTGRDVEEDDLETVRLSELAADCWGAMTTADATLTVVDDVAFRAAPGRVARALENLLRNAVDHGGDGVAIRVGRLPDGDGFYVEDDGPGIPADDREAVFDSGYTTGSGGVGLGLAIVQGVVAAHGWHVAATEAGDGGARFEVSDVIVVA